MTTKSFREMTPDEQRAHMRNEAATVSDDQVRHFIDNCFAAAKQQIGHRRIVLWILGHQGLIVRPEGTLERQHLMGLSTSPATEADAQALEDAVRRGQVQVEVHVGVGLLGPHTQVAVLHKARGRYVPFGDQGVAAVPPSQPEFVSP